MACFNHRDRESVSGCKACGRALCPECIAEVGRSLACKDRCEDDVRLLDAMIADNIRNAPFVNMSLQSSRQGRFIAPVLFVIGGLACVIWGAYEYRDSGEYSSLLAFGVILTIFGLPRLLTALRDLRQKPFPAGYCQRCGYDLRGNLSGRCPECGRKT